MVSMQHKTHELSSLPTIFIIISTWIYCEPVFEMRMTSLRAEREILRGTGFPRYPLSEE
ncbi:MAG: hypothetical protein AB1847_17325 [bacterium]